KSEMSAVSAESRVTESSFNRLANFTNRTWQMFAAGAAALLGVVLGLKSAALEAARMSDVYGQVQKYTGETADGVAALNDELKKMDTRTARDELNRLMGEAGKLGVTGKDNLLQFAKAADIIQVSLGDDLGADAVKNIGKLTYMFGVQDKMGMEKSILAVGSAINEVGQKSTASEPYLLEFTNRLSGMGVAAGLTIPQIIGFGSVLDQNAQQVEMSSTAMNKFISTLATKSENVAKAIGVPAAKLKKAVGEDMNAALLMVFEQLNKKGGLIDLAPLFSDLGAEGARAASVITILASKFKDVGTEQALASKSFADGTSVVKEFNVQNNTMQAKVDKSKKAFLDASETLGKSLSPAFLHSTNAAVYMIKALSQLPEWLSENKGLLLTLTVTLGIYTIELMRNSIAVKLNAAETFISNTWTKAGIVIDYLAAAAKALLTGNITRARAAMRLLNAEMVLNPWVALGVVIAAITVLLYKLATSQTAVQKAWKEFNINSQIEIQTADQLFTAVKKTNEGTAERKKLIDQINTKYGQYLTNQLTEKSNLDDIAEAQKTVNIALREKIAIETKEKAKSDLTKTSVEKQVKSFKDLGDAYTKAFGEDAGLIMKREFEDKLNANPDFMGLTTVDEQKRLWQKFGWKAKDVIYYMNKYTLERRDLQDKLNAIDKQFEGIYNGPYDPNKSNLSGEAIVTGTRGKKKPTTTTTTLTDKETPYDKELKLKEQFFKDEEAVNKKAYADEIIGEEVFHDWMYNAKLDFLNEKLKLDKKYKKDTTATEIEISDLIISENEYWNNKIKAEAEKLLKEEKKTNKDTEKETKDHLKRIEEIRSEFGLQGLKLTYTKQLDLLKEKLQAEKATEEETAQAIADFKRKVAEDYINKGAEIAGKLSQAVVNLQEMETIAVDARYAKEIAAAEKAGKDTTALQEQVEEEKKAIKKKYAGIDFAITTAKIIGETAAAIMKASPNVPLQIAEGILGATQLGLALAQFNSVQQLWTGGFTEPGGKYKPAGIVHAGEFVANQEAVNHSPMRKVFNLVDHAQRTNSVARITNDDIIRSLSVRSGYANGGFVGGNSVTNNNGISTGQLIAAIQAATAENTAVNAALLTEIQKGIKANVSASGKNGVVEAVSQYNKLITNAGR
ncbi:MAG: phage tail tape measure protein, partial [Bacteroidales bacterium]